MEGGMMVSRLKNLTESVIRWMERMLFGTSFRFSPSEMP